MTIMIDSGNRQLTWPSREQWANERRTLYADELGDVPYSQRLDDYATAEEQAEAIRTVEGLIRELGRQMLAIRRKVPHLLRRPREQSAAFHERWCAMSPSNQDPVNAYYDAQWNRRTLSQDVLKAMRNGLVPPDRDVPARGSGATESRDAD